MAGTTKNARELLPKHLYEEVCKYGSGHWWFAPNRPDRKEEVKRQVHELRLQGVEMQKIAIRVNRTVRRVQQILAEKDP